MQNSEDFITVTVIVNFLDKLPSPVSIKFDDLAEIVVSKITRQNKQDIEVEKGKEVTVNLYSFPLDDDIKVATITRAQTKLIFEKEGVYDITFERNYFGKLEIKSTRQTDNKQND